MNVAVICELNPMHNGHRAVFEFARNLGQGGNCVVAVMSGNFCQRGEPALVDKWNRARMAVLGGADIVLEIPSVYAQQSAQFFAEAAVSVVCRSGICDALVFGSECGDIELLKGLAGRRSTGGFGDEIRQLMDSGLSYPRALSAFYGIELAANDILGVEYIAALAKRSSEIEVYCMKRVGNSAHGSDCIESGAEIASAASIRKLVCESGRQAKQTAEGLPAKTAEGLPEQTAEEFGVLQSVMPKSSFDILKGLVAEGRFVRSLRAYNSLIIGKIRELGADGVRELPFAGGGLAECICAAAAETRDVSELVSIATSKSFTSSRIRRILLATLTGARQSMFAGPITVPYVRVLAVSAARNDLLSALMRAAAPVVFGNVPKDYKTALPQDAADLLAREILATDYYVLGYEAAKAPARLELTTPLLKV